MRILFFAVLIICLGLLMRRTFRSPKNLLARHLPWRKKARVIIMLGAMRLVAALMGTIFILGCVFAVKPLFKTVLEGFHSMSVDSAQVPLSSPITSVVLIVALCFLGRMTLKLCDKISRARAGDETPQTAVKNIKGLLP